MMQLHDMQSSPKIKKKEIHNRIANVDLYHYDEASSTLGTFECDVKSLHLKDEDTKPYFSFSFSYLYLKSFL